MREKGMEIIYGNKAVKQLTKINKGNKKMFAKIDEAIVKYAENPECNIDVKPLIGLDNYYRIRINEYRIIFQIEDEKMLILDVDLRGSIYKKG